MLLYSKHLGIDLKAHNIKIAHLVKKGKKQVIKSLNEIENPIGNTIFSKPEEQEIIQKSFKKINSLFPSNRVVIGIPSSYLVFRYLQLPKLNKKELNEAIFWEAQEFSGIFNGKFVSDFELLEKDRDSYRVLLVGAPKDIIMNYTRVAYGAGFRLRALDIYPLANARMLKAKKSPCVTAVIDLGFSHSEITVVNGGKAIFNRNIDFYYTDIFNNALLDFISNRKDWADIIKNGIKTIPVPLQELLLEISRFFNLYYLQNNSYPIDEILLVNKGNKLNHLKDIIKEYFNLKVVTAQEFDDTVINYFSAIGFALRG